MFDCQLLCVSIPPPVSYLFFSHPWILPQCEFVMFATNCFLNNRLPVARRTNMGSQSKRKKKKENHLENLVFVSWTRIFILFLYFLSLLSLCCISFSRQMKMNRQKSLSLKYVWSQNINSGCISCYPLISCWAKATEKLPLVIGTTIFC